jgi:hypothetical protein
MVVLRLRVTGRESTWVWSDDDQRIELSVIDLTDMPEDKFGIVTSAIVESYQRRGAKGATEAATLADRPALT